MAPSGSKEFTNFGEGLTAEGNSMASSSSGTGQPAQEDVEALSISGEGASAREEHSEDRDSTTCSGLKSKREGASAHEEHAEDGDFTTCSGLKAKRARRDVADTISLGTKLDVGMWSMLDDHLLEKIFARLPFKSLFQVPSLSRFWRARFGSPKFRSEVHCSSSASSCNSYTPLFVNQQKHIIMGYESASEKWHSLTNLSYLEQNMVREWALKAAAGSLLCWVCPHARDWMSAFDIHVTNPLTKSWKQLPPRPNMIYPEIVQVGLEEGSNAYKVLVGTLQPRESLDDRYAVRVQIYDSKDDAWIMESYKIVTNCAVTLGGSALKNGVLYVFLSTIEICTSCSLISFHVKRKMWSEIPDLGLIGSQDPPLKYSDSPIQFSQLFSCGSDVILLLRQIASSDMNSLSEVSGVNWCVAYEVTLSVFKLDFQRGLAFEVSRDSDFHVQTADAAASRVFSAASQDDCIYISGDLGCLRALYNLGNQRGARDFPRALHDVKSKQWHRLNPPRDWNQSSAVVPRDPWRISIAYQPGFNPFLEV